MTVVQASPKIKQRDLARKATYEDLLLKAKEQIQPSSMYDMEESWTELNPRVGSQVVNLFYSRRMASASNSFAKKVVELQEDQSNICLTHF